MLLITTFMELHVIAGRSRMQAGHPYAASGRPMLILTCHVMPMPRCGLEKSLSEWHGRGMACVNQTRPHCVKQMGKTQSKPLAARHVWIRLNAPAIHNLIQCFSTLDFCLWPPVRAWFICVAPPTLHRLLLVKTNLPYCHIIDLYTRICLYFYLQY
jgi:hypothetical protein